MMNPKDKETLDAILVKDKDTLSQGEVDFLMARRSYLNDEDKKRYADLIKAHESAVKSGKVGKSADGLDELSDAKLTALAKKEKVDIAGLKEKPEIVAAIRAAREAADAE